MTDIFNEVDEFLMEDDDGDDPLPPFPQMKNAPSSPAQLTCHSLPSSHLPPSSSPASDSPSSASPFADGGFRFGRLAAGAGRWLGAHAERYSEGERENSQSAWTRLNSVTAAVTEHLSRGREEAAENANWRNLGEVTAAVAGRMAAVSSAPAASEGMKWGMGVLKETFSSIQKELLFSEEETEVPAERLGEARDQLEQRGGTETLGEESPAQGVIGGGQGREVGESRGSSHSEEDVRVDSPVSRSSHAAVQAATAAAGRAVAALSAHFTRLRDHGDEEEEEREQARAREVEREERNERDEERERRTGNREDDREGRKEERGKSDDVGDPPASVWDDEFSVSDEESCDELRLHAGSEAKHLSVSGANFSEDTKERKREQSELKEERQGEEGDTVGCAKEEPEAQVSPMPRPEATVHASQGGFLDEENGDSAPRLSPSNASSLASSPLVSSPPTACPVLSSLVTSSRSPEKEAEAFSFPSSKSVCSPEFRSSLSPSVPGLAAPVSGSFPFPVSSSLSLSLSQSSPSSASLSQSTSAVAPASHSVDSEGNREREDSGEGEENRERGRGRAMGEREEEEWREKEQREEHREGDSSLRSWEALDSIHLTPSSGVRTAETSSNPQSHPSPGDSCSPFEGSFMSFRQQVAPVSEVIVSESLDLQAERSAPSSQGFNVGVSCEEARQAKEEDDQLVAPPQSRLAPQQPPFSASSPLSDLSRLPSAGSAQASETPRARPDSSDGGPPGDRLRVSGEHEALLSAFPRPGSFVFENVTEKAEIEFENSLEIAGNLSSRSAASPTSPGDRAAASDSGSSTPEVVGSAARPRDAMRLLDEEQERVRDLDHPPSISGHLSPVASGFCGVRADARDETLSGKQRELSSRVDDLEESAERPHPGAAADGVDRRDARGTSRTPGSEASLEKGEEARRDAGTLDDAWVGEKKNTDWTGDAILLEVEDGRRMGGEKSRDGWSGPGENESLGVFKPRNCVVSLASSPSSVPSSCLDGEEHREALLRAAAAVVTTGENERDLASRRNSGSSASRGLRRTPEPEDKKLGHRAGAESAEKSAKVAGFHRDDSNASGFKVDSEANSVSELSSGQPTPSMYVRLQKQIQQKEAYAAELESRLEEKQIALDRLQSDLERERMEREEGERRLREEARSQQQESLREESERERQMQREVESQLSAQVKHLEEELSSLREKEMQLLEEIKKREEAVSLGREREEELRAEWKKCEEALLLQERREREFRKQTERERLAERKLQEERETEADRDFSDRLQRLLEEETKNLQEQLHIETQLHDRKCGAYEEELKAKSLEVDSLSARLAALSATFEKEKNELVAQVREREKREGNELAEKLQQTQRQLSEVHARLDENVKSLEEELRRRQELERTLEAREKEAEEASLALHEATERIAALSREVDAARAAREKQRETETGLLARVERLQKTETELEALLTSESTARRREKEEYDLQTEALHTRVQEAERDAAHCRSMLEKSAEKHASDLEELRRERRLEEERLSTQLLAASCASADWQKIQETWELEKEEIERERNAAFLALDETKEKMNQLSQQYAALAADLATKQKEVDALRASSRRGSALSASCGDCAKTEEIENGGSADNEAEERREREDEQDRLAQLLAANVEINLLQRELEALKEEVREVKDERGGLQESLKKVQEQKEKAEATVATLKAEMEAVAAASPAREGRVEPLEARRESDLAYWQSQLAERDHRIALLTSERNALSYRLQLKTVGGDAEKKGRETNEKRLGGDAQRERESPRDAEAPRASELQDLEAGEELFEENPRASLRGREEKRGALVATARKAGRVARHVKLYARAIWGDLRSGGCTPWKAKSWQPIDRPFKDFSRVLADSGAHRLAFYLYFLLLHVLFFFRLFFPPLGPAAPCSGALSSDVASFGAVPTLHPPSPPS
ncbi:hypothetical protein TGME49_321410 [Toxoplasma gondii ME49]|uniref:Transmembrane protein n=1 Tax=Toxoplasma gondii (strain ATCC 50611 / Me49) TaxID=508771 RepID=S8F8I5_TOXGM|nr:hypothetical protein TGME49_321410 [Toxoplasma gondii ME49]EPT32231.1 hypothetical protein TGME49_321410 [Toxoplasma gondii ME49]|eukprot:XP_018638398.1 hypothetical protein TGME49_321410 [Toxoplasma gondii ME49]